MSWHDDPDTALRDYDRVREENEAMDSVIQDLIAAVNLYEEALGGNLFDPQTHETLMAARRFSKAAREQLGDLGY